MQDWLSEELNNLWDWIADVGIQFVWGFVIILAILFGSRWLRLRTKGAARKRHYNPNVVSLIDNITKVIIYTIIFFVILKLFGVGALNMGP